ncbi:ClbS/DfsB family four-helix bundle protein [Ktedonosporobacter rubrisoli]|uniref:ClbS/DfsB family four-helix bundle protein n=1 Tax=Ktedonosporobacter rubrisoli TaxID=2509675 RepID=A0A4P6JY90_KTERU|nr:DinB family protein [Ktedonosporobacter rubrisoli]QBD80759.1 ClbS/DfsB family four-helix bundle protein [Ktedonosporobacter rubrisoli]
MTQHPFKPVLLDLLRQAQNSQNAFFQQLPPAELEAIGTPDHWSARDHVAHLTFWRQRLILRVQAILDKKPQPPSQDYTQVNPLIFEEHRHRPWSTLFAESEAAYARLITLTEQLSEEDLTAFNRINWTDDGEPFYSAFMSSCYEHTQQHLAQYSLDRQDLEQATNTYETWARRVIEAEVPERLKGIIYYNLACFYALQSQLGKARAALQQAFTLASSLREIALSDPELSALRPDFS